MLLISVIIALGTSYHVKQQVTDQESCVFKHMMWSICTTSGLGLLIAAINSAVSMETLSVVITLMTAISFYFNRMWYKSEQKYAINN